VTTSDDDEEGDAADGDDGSDDDGEVRASLAPSSSSSPPLPLFPPPPPLSPLRMSNILVSGLAARPPCASTHLLKAGSGTAVPPEPAGTRRVKRG